MEIRKILTKSSAREWFANFGNPEKGLTFEKIFGNMDLSADDTWTYKVQENIMFIKIKVRYFDTFGCTPCYDNLEQFMILPQVVDKNIK